MDIERKRQKAAGMLRAARRELAELESELADREELSGAGVVYGPRVAAVRESLHDAGRRLRAIRFPDDLL